MITGLETLRTQLGDMPEGRCLAGFSGGADSTAMIMLLAAERDAGRLLPEAIHVNHGLRGAESEEDESFCRRICEELRIPIHTERVRLNEKSDENACREARFRCFRKVMDETGIRTLILAHNMDDLAETFMMRLIRGAGTEGLACMSERDERSSYTIFRPLLKISRKKIRETLMQHGIHWREDSLNESEDYLRNKVRSRLIPLLNELNEGATRRIANTAEIINGDNQVLQKITEDFLAANSNGRMIDAEALKRQPEALLCRILRCWWKRNMPDLEEHTLNARKTAELTALARSERGKINLPGGYYAEKGKTGMYLTGFPKKPPVEIPYIPGSSGETVFGDVCLITEPSEGNPGNGITEQEVPEEFLAGCVIRTRREGDRIRPFGMEGSRKLQDYLTDRGIDEPLRDQIPLICRHNEVLLAAGVGAGAVPKWNAQKKNIRLKWEGKMPWIIV